MNLYNDYVEAGMKSNFHGKGHFGSVEIHREGSPQRNELSELDISELESVLFIVLFIFMIPRIFNSI